MINKSLMSRIIILLLVGQTLMAMDEDYQPPKITPLDDFEKAFERFSSLDIGLLLFMGGSQVPSNMGLQRFIGEDKSDNFKKLPIEIFEKILSHLGRMDFVAMMLVDKSSYQKIYNKFIRNKPLSKKDLIDDAAFHLNRFSFFWSSDSVYAKNSEWAKRTKFDLEASVSTNSFVSEEESSALGLSEPLMLKSFRPYDEKFIQENFIEIIVLANNDQLLAFVMKAEPQARKDFCKFAARHGNRAFLSFGRENNFPWLSLDQSSRAYWFGFACEAARNSHLDCLQYFVEQGHVFNEIVCAGAADGGNLACLKFVHENGGGLTVTAACSAARNGHFECFKYVNENGVGINSNDLSHLICGLAAEGGNLDCLKYAHEHGYPWDRATCLHAAANGRLDCLKYAYEHGCPWDELTCSRAAANGHLDCLKYAYEHGCPWDEHTGFSAAEGGHLDCLKYAHDNDCPHTRQKNPDSPFSGLRKRYEYPPGSGEYYLLPLR